MGFFFRMVLKDSIRFIFGGSQSVLNSVQLISYSNYFIDDWILSENTIF